MTRVVVSPQARDDLLQIVVALSAVAGLATADKWDRKIWQAVDDIGQFPGQRRAATCARRARPHRSGASLRRDYDHIRGEDVVHLLRVVHGRRNITKELLPG